MLDRLALAAALHEIGTLLAIAGGQRFKSRAYLRGAAALQALQGDVTRLLAEGRLTDMPGIGPALAGVIGELAGTGQSGLLERLRASLPRGVQELVRVPGVTLRRLRLLQEGLGIASVADLEAACSAGRVRSLAGFGEKTERRLLAGVAALRERIDAVLLPVAERETQALLDLVRTLPGVELAEGAGDLRRCTETVAELVVAVATAEPEPVLAGVLRHPAAAGVVERTPEAVTLRLASGLVARVETALPARHAALMLHLTGSPAHRERLVQVAAERGLRLDRHGLWRAGSGTPLPAGSEADLYRHLGLAPIPPELREDAGEIEAARTGTLPPALLQEHDLAGMVHCHTVWSDGKHDIEAMARAAQAMGMRYLTITDHSPSAHYAGGLDEGRLRAQWDEIARVQDRVGIELLRGTECDILADGSLDWPAHLLAELDVVIASIHNRHKMDVAEMTRRLVAAMRQPVFKIWGHALGRYVRSRPPIECDMEAVLDAAAESRVAIEVNGDPNRLDLEPKWQRLARARGIPFVVSSDAHSTAALANVRFGVATARRGWLQRDEVLNTRDAAGFRAAVRPRG